MKEEEEIKEEKKEEEVEKPKEEQEEGPVMREGREMWPAVCSDCGQKCFVPFRPTEGRPIYCRECFSKHRPPRRF
jgi:CxxC-x17-CxxC domain-containing protein